MDNVNKISFIVVYIISSIFSIYYIIRCKKKNGKLRIIDFFNIYYTLVYFIVPIFSFYNTSHTFMINYARYFNYSTVYHLISFFYSIIFIHILNYIYNKATFKFRQEKEIKINIISFFSLNLFFTIVGFIAYYLWTKVYGFPFGIIKYADLLRDGTVIVNNPYTIMQPFCNFLSLSAYMWLVYSKNEKNTIMKIISKILFCFSFFFALVSALATDGRMSIIVVFLVPIVYHLNYNKISIKKLIIIGVFSLLLLGNLNNITYFIRNGKKNTRMKSENLITNIISDEFGYTYTNRINLLNNIKYGDINITEGNDLLNIVFAWVPKSKKPDYLISLSKYNTSLYRNPSGAIPTDIVTAGIYKGRFLGVIFLSIFVGLLIKFLDNFFMNKSSDFYKMIYTIIGVTITLRLVAYYDISEILFSRFALIIYYFSVSIMCKRRIHNENV